MDLLFQAANQTYSFVYFVRTQVNYGCEGLEAWQIIMWTLLTAICASWSYEFVFDADDTVAQRLKKGFFYHAKRLPIVRGIVKKEMSKVLPEMGAKKLYGLKPGMTYMTRLPAAGKNLKEIMDAVDDYQSLDVVDWKGGNCSGTVYGGGSVLTDVTCAVYKKFAWSNPLHPDIFPSVRKIEAEIVRMSCNLFHGDPADSCGNVSAGGTESIMLACKAYRDWAYDKGIKKPEIVCPISVHAAFEKAAHYFRMRLIHVPVEAKSRKVDVLAMRRAISKNTCVLVGSAPQFPHGVVDPIGEIAELGLRYNIPVHVDACLGGFLLPFMKDAGFPLAPFDFSVPGVTSISADTHKYGLAPKGSSVIMYSSKKWIHYQHFVTPDWQGGIYATHTFAGSRSGAVVAACWAAMMHTGYDGYVENTRKIVGTARYIVERLREIDGVFVFGEPEMSVVALGSFDFDILRLSTDLVQRGWNLNTLQFPPSVHLCCTLPTTEPGVADRFVRDVSDCTRLIMLSPQAKTVGAGAMYGMAQALPDRSIVSELTTAYLDAYYDTTNYNASSSNSKHGGFVNGNGFANGIK